MLDNGGLGFSFGCYFGLLFHASKWPCMHVAELMNEARWKPFVRLAVTGGMCLPVLSLYLLSTNQISNVYVLMIFKTFLPTLISGFIIFGLGDAVNIKLKLLKFRTGLHDPLIEHDSDDLELKTQQQRPSTLNDGDDTEELMKA